VSQVLGDERPQLLAQSLRRYAFVVLVLALLGGAATAAYAASRPQTFSSSSRILLRPSTGNPYSVETGPSGQQVTIAMTTEAALVDSDPVLKLVNEKLAPDLAAADVSVSVPANTSTIVARVRASSAAEAQRGAQAVADGYLAYRSGVTTASRTASVDQLTRQIGTAKASLAKASAEAAKESGDSQAARQAQVLTEQLISLQDLLNSAQSIDADPGTLVSPASPAVRTGVQAGLIIAAGVLLGLMVGTAMALWLGRRDRRVHAKAGSAVSGVPVLAILGGRRGTDAAEAERQAYQRLRTSVLASSAMPSAVAVSGVSGGDSSSVVSLELGRSMIRAGYQVVLVIASADEKGPFADDKRGARGLADALREGRPVAGLLVDHEGLAVLSAGSGILEQQELLSGERFARVVTELKSHFDYVLVVTGPAVLPAELATARLADALLLVGRDGATSRIDIADVASRARLVGLRVSGLVLRSRGSRGGSKGRAVPVEGPHPSSSVSTGSGSDSEHEADERRRESRIAAERA
jgi:Mrp family chromosome partitioning ATPase/capsular polysaccharide biosynthesis protein